MHVGAHFAVSWDTLWTLACEDWAREFIPCGSPWDRLFELSYMPTYREIISIFWRRSSFILFSQTRLWTRRTPPPRGFFVLCRLLSLRVIAVYIRRLRSLRIHIRRYV
ncbi:hypothetical protein Hanom_Chr04g00311281 [Helianthus anomalus]